MATAREAGPRQQRLERCDPHLLEVPDGAAVGGHVVETGSDCGPCPPDPVGPNVPFLNRIVTERTFVVVEPGRGPVFYTSRPACKNALKRLPKPLKD